MKKILSVLLAFVMVFGMFAATAVTASAAEESATISFADTANRTVATTAQQVWVQNNITVTNDKASSTSNVNTNYYNPVRLYKGSSLTIACGVGNITKIEVTCSSSSYATALKNSVTSGTATVSNSVVTITPATTAADTYTIDAMSAQVRVASMVVYYVAGSCAHTNTTTTTEEATCFNDGQTVVSCADCGAVMSTTVIPFTGHSFVDGTCENCALAQADVTCYQQVAAVDADADGFVDDVTEGLYIIGAPKSGEYPTINLATATIVTNSSNKDWSISTTPAKVVNDIVSADLLAADVQVFELAGDNTNGFTIGYHNGTENVYLGYSAIATNRRLGFSAEYSTILWTVKLNSEGNVYLCSTDGTNYYAVSYNSDAGDIRGYNAESKVYGCTYLFKCIGGGGVCIHEWSDWTVDIAPTCTTGGSESRSCGLCQEVQTSPIDATGHDYHLGDEVVVEATCANCDLKLEKTDIADLRSYTADTLYFFEGVVTYINGMNVYIEDSTGGICVCFDSASENDHISLGDKIRVCDTLTTYNGLIETTYTLAKETSWVASNRYAEVQATDIATLNAATDNSYLSEKISLENVQVTVSNYSSSYKNVTYTLSDGTNTIDIFRASAPTADVVIPAGAIVNVEAVVSVYNGTSQLLIQDHSWMEITGWFNDVLAYEGDKVVATYTTVEEAVAAYTAGTQYIQLLNDAEVALQLTQDLYIDLNGHYIEGSIDVGDFKIYGMDSATNEYGDSEGYMDCTSSDGSSIAVEAIFRTTAELTGDIRSYMAVEGDNGWTFNRFYVGVTHVTLKTATSGIGYKAVFYGNDLVAGMLDDAKTFGFTLSLAGGNTVTRTMEGITSGRAVTLRIDNYDVANFGAAELSAQVSVVLADGTALTSTVATTSMKQVIETLNADTTLTAEKLAAVSAYVEANYEAMKDWAIGNLYTKEEVAA